MNVWILCNEDAGRSLSADDVRTLVEHAGHTVAGVANRYDADTALPHEQLDLVVAAGGDGTVATAAGIALRTSAALAILPLGTANNIARSLGVEAPPHELVSSWSTARHLPFDLGHAQAANHDWLVVEGVGGGLVPAGIARSQAELEGRQEMSPAAEVAAAVRAFRDTLVELEPRLWTLVLDGRRISDEFLLVEILNIRSIGPNLVFGPDANPSDGFFDVVMAQECHRQELLTYLERHAAGEATRLELPRHRAREVTIERCMEVHVDDERVDTCELGQLSIRIEPAAIAVLVSRSERSVVVDELVDQP